MLTFSLHPFPLLHTPRLLLRRCVTADVPALFRMRADPEVMRYVARPLCQNEADAAKILQTMDERIEGNAGINWAVSWRQEPDSFLGVIGLFRLDADNHRGEVGYMLATPYWGQGLVSELLPVVMQYGFSTLGLHSIGAVIDPDNHASRRVLEKSGFVQEAHFRQNWYFEGKYLDSVVLSALVGPGHQAATP